MSYIDYHKLMPAYYIFSTILILGIHHINLGITRKTFMLSPDHILMGISWHNWLHLKYSHGKININFHKNLKSFLRDMKLNIMIDTYSRELSNLYINWHQYMMRK